MDNKHINTPANMQKRILFGALILAVVVGFILLRQVASSTVFLFDTFVGFLMVGGAFEVAALLEKMNRPNYIIMIGLFPIAIFVIALLTVLLKWNFITFLLVGLVCLVAFFIAALLIGILLKKKTLTHMYLDDFSGSRFEYVLKKSANSMFACIYPTFLLGFMFLINHFSEINPNALDIDVGFFGIILLFATTMCADTCAFLVGRLIKSKKISITKLGPGKTWSGLCGGIMGGIIAAIVVFLIFNSCGYGEFFAQQGLSVLSFVFVGLFCGIFNMLGDIFASFIKRRAGIKDFSNFIPGHGGVMDRINGLLVNATVIFVMFVIMF